VSGVREATFRVVYFTGSLLLESALTTIKFYIYFRNIATFKEAEGKGGGMLNVQFKPERLHLWLTLKGTLNCRKI